MNDLVLIIVGLAVTAGSAIISTVYAQDFKPVVKWVLMALAALGFLVGVGYAVKDNSDKIASDEHAKTLQSKIDELKAEAAMISTGVGAIELKAEDLVALNQIAGDNVRYYVQVAAGGSPEDLEGPRSRLRSQFGIPKTNNMVAVIDREKLGFRNLSKSRFALVFGHHQKLAAAEVFQRLANSHHLSPTDRATGQQEFAAIIVEPADFLQAIVPE
jgi:hypothetical protein